MSIFNTTDPHRFGVFVVAPEGVVRVTGLTHAQAKAWAQGEPRG